MYPYTALSSTLEYLIPTRGLPAAGRRGGRAIQEFCARHRSYAGEIAPRRLSGYSNVRVAFSGKHKDWIGQTIPDIVRAKWAARPRCATRSHGCCATRWAATSRSSPDEMSEADVRQLITAPDMVFGSDSSIHYRGVGRPHPRGAGTFPRIFAEYVRDRETADFGGGCPPRHGASRGNLRPSRSRIHSGRRVGGCRDLRSRSSSGSCHVRGSLA